MGPLHGLAGYWERGQVRDAGGPGRQPSTAQPLAGRLGVQLMAGMSEQGDGTSSTHSSPQPSSWLQQARFW